MPNSRPSGLLLTLSVFALLWLALPRPAAAEIPAQVDSLVWYIEDLEHQLAICEIRGKAGRDSLRVELAGANLRLQWALEDRPRWYEKPGMAFMAGAVLALVVFGQVVKVTF